MGLAIFTRACVRSKGAYMMALMSPRIWLALALAGFLTFTHFSAYRAGKAAVRADFDAYKLAQVQATQKAQEEAHAKEQAWQDAANATTKAKDDQIRSINARLNTALRELRNRPERPAVVPENTGACRSGTGAGLYRPDAEFLAGLAARADQVAAERDACYAQYRALTN